VQALLAAAGLSFISKVARLDSYESATLGLSKEFLRPLFPPGILSVTPSSLSG